MTSDGGVGPPSSQQSVGELVAKRPKNSGRYLLAGEIARGGMGRKYDAQ
jgi:hypothetical protein